MPAMTGLTDGQILQTFDTEPEAWNHARLYAATLEKLELTERWGVRVEPYRPPARAAYHRRAMGFAVVVREHRRRATRKAARHVG
jgi:hypothetical protein